MLRFFGLNGSSERRASLPAATRVYAIGDVHGRRDLLLRLLAAVEAEQAMLAPARVFLIFLGDLIDRGPDSRGVLELLLDTGVDWATCIFLKGNHEEALLASLAGDEEALLGWLRFGGSAFVESYGLKPERLHGMTTAMIAREIGRLVPEHHRRSIDGFYDSFAVGDYLFVHAGVRPGVAIVDQQARDLRWIRGDFLASEADHGKVIVHGHTIVETAEDRGNRIALDTGAYRTGRLTALRLEGEERRYLVAEMPADALPASAADAGGVLS